MKHRRFTLVEVIVALAILGLGLTSFLTLSSSSQNRLAKARERWTRMHMLAQGAEYFMLFRDEEVDGIPVEFFDYPGYRLQCRYEDPEGLPEDYETIEGMAPLRRCIIELVRTSDGEVVDSLSIDRIDYDANTVENN